MSSPGVGLAVPHVAPEAVAGEPKHPRFFVVTARNQFSKVSAQLLPEIKLELRTTDFFVDPERTENS